MKDVPYLLRGITPVPTESSALVSSSKFLNNPRLRDWLPMALLRKNGPDIPIGAEMYGFADLLGSMRDKEAIEEKITQERRINPAFDAWLSEWHISKFTVEDLGGYPAGSLGGTFHEWLTGGNYEIELRAYKEPTTQLEYIELRAGQTHDFEHLICGGEFTAVGELVPYWMRLTNLFTHLGDQELAAELAQISIFGQLRYTVRTLLHYPYAWLACVGAIQRGIQVGQQSGPIFTFKYEPVFHLPIEEARAVLGVRNATECDTSLAAEIIYGRAAPEEMRRQMDIERGLLTEKNAA